MDNTKFIQNSAKASFNRTLEKKCINFTAVTIITAIILMAVALISSSIVAGVDAEPRSTESPRDICIGAGDRCYCGNDTVNPTEECCVTGGGNTVCETCDIDTKTGDYVNCSISGGKPLDNSKTHGNPRSSGALGSQPQNPSNGLLILIRQIMQKHLSTAIATNN